MAIIWQDGFDHYGDGFANSGFLTQGAYAEVNNSFTTSAAPAGARTGFACLFIQPEFSSLFRGVRLVLPATKTRLFIHQAIYLPALPVDNGNFYIIDLRDNANVVLGDVTINSTGSLTVRNQAGTTLLTTANNTVVAGTWFHVQIDWTINAATGAVAIFINNVQVVNLTAQNTGSTAIGQLRWRTNNTNSLTGFYVDDLVISDTTGAINTALLGDLRVNTTLVVGNGPSQGWTQQPRFKYGNGILTIPQGDGNGNASTDGVYCNDSADFEFTNGDFTMEGHFRWTALPTASNQHTLFSKWREPTNERAYQLFLGSTALNGGKIAFRISTDGQAGTVATITSQVFTPVIGHWYHIAVQRNGGNTQIFIDGVAQNAPVADANNYNNNTSVFFVGMQQFGSVSGLTGTGFVGHQEELRITKGVGRYVSGFVPPTAAYPRNVGGDASFNSVVLLAGYDSAVTDESSFGRAINTLGLAGRFAVDDSGGAFQTINNQPARDDTYVEAPFIAASGQLVFTGQPANNETVVFDTVTYTFKTVFVNNPGVVLIGASVDASINNLVAAIDAGAGSGTVYGAGTTPSANATAANIGNNIMSATANTAGTAGNAIGSTETIANASWTQGVTLLGGLNIPGPSTFTLGRLPANTTGVRALTIVKRARKTDAGPGTVQAAFLTANLSTANGAATPLTTSLTYYQDVIETDPNTAGALTPATFIGATVRVDRTA